MKNIFTLLFFSFSLFTIANAQKTEGSIKGKLIDTAATQPIADATVSVINKKDSSLTSFTLSNKQGAFEVKGLQPGDYRLVITHQGYVEFVKPFSISTINKVIDMGNLSVQK